MQCFGRIGCQTETFSLSTTTRGFIRTFIVGSRSMVRSLFSFDDFFWSTKTSFRSRINSSHHEICINWYYSKYFYYLAANEATDSNKARSSKFICHLAQLDWIMNIRCITFSILSWRIIPQFRRQSNSSQIAQWRYVKSKKFKWWSEHPILRTA